MRKFIFIICIFVVTVFGYKSESKAESADSCEIFLADTKFDYPKKLNETLSLARKILDKSKSLKFISKSKYDHLLDDLNELSKDLHKKSQNQSFIEMINKWYNFGINLEKQMQSFESLSEDQQKLYFDKMRMPVSFMTSHFITFLETKHLKFSYQRMYSILKFNAEINTGSDMIIFLYEFEKQVLKFFSKEEFVRCNA